VTAEEQPASQRQRIDPYVGQYAERAVGMVASEIRALFAVAARPEIVSLAGGSPYVAALPLDAVGEMIRQLIADRGDTALQYCTAQGDCGLRERICDVMALEQIRAHPDEIVVTVGSQQALDLLARIFIDPGDVILAEAPSYVGALGAFASYQAAVVHVAMDCDGLIPQALEEAIRRTTAAGRRAKFLYTVPNFHNPAGVTLAARRRPQILDICQRAGLLVVEDNPYGLLGFDGEPMRALRADDDEGVVYLGTFSKTFAAGVRVGWAVAPAAIRDKLILAAESAVLCHSSFSQLTVREYLTTQPWLEQIKDFRELYRERRDATLHALEEMMPPGCHWTRPGGGFYVWLRLPDGVNAKAMLPRAISSRVAYVPGTGFYADGSGGRYARLCYSFPSPDRIREGIRRLASVIETEIELRDDFGPAPGIRLPEIMYELDRVVVLAGGLSAEREVSLRSGDRVRDALAEAGIDAVVADADSDLLAQLHADPPSAVFPVIHGACGEDGAIREVLGLLGAPYVGSVASACQMAFDKPTAKALVAAAGVSTPASVTLPRETFHDLGAAAVIDLIVAKLGLPLYIKPSRGGSALGAGPVHDAAALPAALLSCFAYGDIALIERFISGTEVTVGVIDLGQGPQALPAVEIVPGDGGYDYAARYTAGKTEFYVPARLPGGVAAQVARIAIAAHSVLGLRDLSRTDLIVDEAGTAYFLEVNVSPGMTETSTLPMALEASGHAFGSICVRLLELAAARDA
jgi:2-aminoadipate transaminase